MRPIVRNFWWLLRRSLMATFDDGCISIAKGAAYSALLSFFPVLTSAATILVQTRAGFAVNMMEKVLEEIVPPDSETLVLDQFRVAGARHNSLLIVAGLVSLWAASGVIKSLVEGFHAAYRVPRNRGFFHGSGVAVALVLVAAVPLVCASLLVLFGSHVETLVASWIKVDPLGTAWQWFSRLARYALSFLTTVVVTSSLYYFGPYRRQQWRYVWPGAILATIMWLLATSGFAWYARNIANYNVMYGSVGAGIALLVWMYLLAIIALIGCEFNAEYERSVRH